MQPEAATPNRHSPAMDVYSFGVLLTEMATGQFPLQHEVLIQSIQWSSSVKQLVLQCTATNPSLRPLTNTLLTTLQQLLERGGEEKNCV